MYQPHKDLVTPPDDAVVWRYMPLAQFLHLLVSKTLYFPTIQTLCKLDPYEGFWRGLTEEELEKLAIDPKYQVFCGMTMSDPGHFLKQLNSLALACLPVQNNCTYVSCWHLNSGESAAMWAQYVRGHHGLAIRSTVGKIKSSFEETPESLHIGTVQYVADHKAPAPWIDNTISESLLPYFHKRLSFAHECEVRIVYADHEGLMARAFSELPDIPLWKGLRVDPATLVHKAVGTSLAVDPEILIEKVFIAPTLPRYIKDVVASIMLKYDLHQPVEHSDIDKGPT